jgi:hypothetical protein
MVGMEIIRFPATPFATFEPASIIVDADVTKLLLIILIF